MLEDPKEQPEQAAETLTPKFPGNISQRRETEAAPLADTNHGIVETDGNELGNPGLPYPVVAIGASAGGLQAFRDMLDQMSPETGMAFVLISHLAPNHDSQIVSLLQRHTRMGVVPIKDGQRPLPNHVHVLMPNQFARLEGGNFRLSERTAKDRSPATINLFFRSLSEDQKNFCVGVVLSGGDGDGAEGLKTIKGAGGFALVQSPDSAIQEACPEVQFWQIMWMSFFHRTP